MWILIGTNCTNQMDFIGTGLAGFLPEKKNKYNKQ